MMKYKGYTGVLEVDEEAGILFGEVIGLRDVITFQGETVEEARASFHESIDFYLKICADQGKPPEKPFSGRFLIRITPTLHRDLVAVAGSGRESLNALVKRALAAVIADPTSPREAPRARKVSAKKAGATTRPAKAEAKHQPAR